jgi:hypothetical protein
MKSLRPVPAVVPCSVLGRKAITPVPAVPCCAPETNDATAVVPCSVLEKGHCPRCRHCRATCARRAEASASGGAAGRAGKAHCPPGASDAVLCARRAEAGRSRRCYHRAVRAGRKAIAPPGCQQCRAVRRRAEHRWCRAVCWEKEAIAPVPAGAVLCARRAEASVATVVPFTAREGPLPRCQQCRAVPEELRPVPAVVPCSALGEGHYSASSAVLCARKTETQCQQWCRAVLGRKSPLPPSASSAVLCEELRPVPAVVPCSAGEKPVL